MGLTQVLDDGTNTYLYGNERIAQIDSSAQYFIDDALGSVRQMTNTSSGLTLSRSYDPCGGLRNDSRMAASTSDGFIMEQP